MGGREGVEGLCWAGQKHLSDRRKEVGECGDALQPVLEVAGPGLV